MEIITDIQNKVNIYFKNSWYSVWVFGCTNINDTIFGKMKLYGNIRFDNK